LEDDYPAVVPRSYPPMLRGRLTRRADEAQLVLCHTRRERLEPPGIRRYATLSRANAVGRTPRRILSGLPIPVRNRRAKLTGLTVASAKYNAKPMDELGGAVTAWLGAGSR
jgi:hypothetical protein